MDKENISKVETLTPYEAARIIRKNAEYIRAGLRSNRFNFGSAIPPKKENGRWEYNIIKNKFLEYAGVSNDETKNK